MKFKSGIFSCVAMGIMLFVSSLTLAQDADLVALRQIDQIKVASEKIEALRKFRMDFPSSRYLPNSYSLSLASFAKLGNVDSTLSNAAKYLSATPESSREQAYNIIAFELTKNKMALDKAKGYINKAVESARKNKLRSLPFFLDTQALVYFNLGKVDSAIIIQKEVLLSNEKNAGYLLSLATYEEAAGNRAAALKTVSKSLLLERADKALDNFNSWTEKEGTDAASREKLKNSICKEAVDEYLKNDSSPNAKSNAAAFLAVLKSDMETAKKLTMEAAESLNDKTSIEDIVLIRTNLAIVYNAMGDLNKTLKELKVAEGLATPWDSDFWMLLGSTYEKLNQNEKALDAYLSTKVVTANEKLNQALKAVGLKLGLNDDAIAKKLDAIKLESKEFEPGVYDKKSSGKKVVVAELFTGAECPPCVAADRAFDKLSEFYPRDAVVILEYHLHIPGPDPMTNPDTHLKYVSYGGNFGTPTVFFDGGSQIAGGGPDYITKNRFNVYKYAIEKSAKQNAGANISGSASLNKDEVNLSLMIEPSSANGNLSNCTVQIALLEKEIDYTGSNGINKHIFVVRDLVNGSDGVPVSLTNGKQNINQKIDVAAAEKIIKTYLDDPSKDPSWRMKSGFAGWKARTDKIDRKNLAVVVYVQNKNTKEILQARLFDL